MSLPSSKSCAIVSISYIHTPTLRIALISIALQSASVESTSYKAMISSR